MPYKVGAANLPKHVRNSPVNEGKAWVDAYNRKYREKKKQGASLSACEQAAFSYANGVLKKIQGRTGPPVKEAKKATPILEEKKVEMTQSIREKLDVLITESAAREVSEELGANIKKLIDEASGEKIKEKFTERVDEVLVTLREAAQMKTEDGHKFPASVFAYVPDREKPSTWKLRLAEPGKGITRAQVGRAAAAFSPSGFRGKPLQIPKADISKTKAKIRAAYRKLGVKDEDMSRWVKEAEPRALVGEIGGVEISEATAEKVSVGTLPVRFLAEGFNTDKSRFYTDQAVRDAVKVFEGLKMYANHPTKSEDRERPERDVRDWVANLRNCRVASSGNAVGDAIIHEGWFKDKVSGLQDAGELTELGLSIIGVGKGVKTTIKDTKTHMIEGIVKARSVDFVTEPGAGGRAGLRESIAAEGYDPENDVDLLDETGLRERRPDLVAIIEAATETKLRKEIEVIDELKEKITELDGQVETLTKERDDLRAELEEAERKERVTTAQKEIAELIDDESDLREATKDRIKAQFVEADTVEGVAEAIDAEKKYVAALNKAGDVKDMGPSDREPDSEKERERIKENAKRRYLDEGFSKEDAERAADIYVNG